MTGVIHKLRSYVLFIAVFFWTKTFSVCDPCKLLCGKELCCAVVEFKCNLTLGLLHCVCSLRLTSLVFCFQGRDDVENEDKGTWSLFCFLYLFNHSAWHNTWTYRIPESLYKLQTGECLNLHEVGNRGGVLTNLVPSMRQNSWKCCFFNIQSFDWNNLAVSISTTFHRSVFCHT